MSIIQSHRVKFAKREVTVHLITEMSDIPSDFRPTGVDTESSSLDQSSPDWRLRLVQLADTETAYCIPAEKFIPGIERGCWAHNAPTDVLALRWGLGVTTDLLDSLALCRLVDPYGFERPGAEETTRLFGLKFMIRKHLDAEYDAELALKKETKETKTDWATIPIENPVYLKYAGLDAIAVAMLVQLMKPSLNDKLKQLFIYEHQVQKITAIGIPWRGLAVDDAAKVDALADCTRTFDEHVFWLTEHGMPSNNRKAIDKEIWVDRLTNWGVKLSASKKTGKASLDKKLVALALANFAPDSDPRIYWRQLSECRIAADHPVRYINKFNGRVHPSIRSMGTITTRITISDPPLQQLPTEGPIRPCLCADEGKVLISADSGQIEFRVAAALSGDPNMKAAVQADDMYSFVSNILRQRRDITKDSPERKKDKVGLLARIYGAGPEKLAMQLDMTTNDARVWVSRLRSAFPRLDRYMQELADGGSIELPNGLIIPIDYRRPHVAGNYMIQATARYLHTDALLRLAKEGLKDKIWLTVHDEIIVQVDPVDSAEVTELMRVNMADTLKGVPIPVEVAPPMKNWTKNS